MDCARRDEGAVNLAGVIAGIIGIVLGDRGSLVPDLVAAAATQALRRHSGAAN